MLLQYEKFHSLFDSFNDTIEEESLYPSKRLKIKNEKLIYINESKDSGVETEFSQEIIANLTSKNNETSIINIKKNNSKNKKPDIITPD